MFVAGTRGDEEEEEKGGDCSVSIGFALQVSWAFSRAR